ncbi:heme-binding beta-barrel domain-containing protein [Aliikangiella sp. G2MR2-5]|uniref:heme-binding beta-barrel domain-containing protein n=1 Tax=Aliikangiella sp. G2MR2-5 TaxID=2788943 RepID=UPI0018A898FB|nr:heme-binding beta-barrel domain-containing protein [Aliikangiella sp. G2MR2-5]
MTSLEQIDYGPLACLVGEWQGCSGIDVSPEEDGKEINNYREILTFRRAGDLDNAETQELVVVEYRQTVHRIDDEKLIHQESGYYSWDSENRQLIKSFSIPRGIAIVASGELNFSSEKMICSLKADHETGISESMFMQENAKTRSYLFEMSVEGDSLTYRQSMTLDIYDREFEHTDKHTLKKIM